jgi:acyl transferase domain-containing protein
VKSNIGHTTAAAGAAGLIKVALALHHEELPGTAHFRAPNPRIPFADTPFRVVDGRTPWPRGARPRLAGVSSFGVGGTNAHVVVAEAPAAEPSGPSAPAQLLVLSAKTPAALERASLALAAHLEAAPACRPRAGRRGVHAGRGALAFAERRAVVARDAAEAARKLRTAGPRRARPRRVAAAAGVPVPGAGGAVRRHGARAVRRGAALPADGGRVRRGGRAAPRPRPARGALPRRGRLAAAQGALRQTAFTQTALFAVEYALARTLGAWGLAPAALCGTAWASSWRRAWPACSRSRTRRGWCARAGS